MYILFMVYIYIYICIYIYIWAVTVGALMTPPLGNRIIYNIEVWGEEGALNGKCSARGPRKMSEAIADKGKSDLISVLLLLLLLLLGRSWAGDWLAGWQVGWLVGWLAGCPLPTSLKYPITQRVALSVHFDN